MKKGFTLIELLAVIVILALIALITIPAVLRITENAKISSYRRSIDLYGGAINTAIMAYKSDMVEKKQPIQVNFDNVIPYVDYEGYDISCEISRIYSDDTILLTKCTIEKDIVYAEKGKGYGSENYYYYTNSKKRIKALLYVEAVNNALKGKENIGTTCEVTSEGNIRCNNQTIEITSELGKPKQGTLIITNNQVTGYSNLKFEDEKVQTQEEVPQVVDEQQINTNPNNDNNNNQNNNNQNNNNNTNNQTNHYATLISDADNDGKISVGDEYTYKVNATDTFTFYVLSIEGTGTNQKVNLIMDNNICTDGTIPTSSNPCRIAWYASSNDNSNGPVTAMEGLYNATKNWTNVPDLNLDYSDEGHIKNSSYGYGKIKTTETGIKIIKKDGTTEVTRSENQTPVIPYDEGKSLKARLPKFEEVYKTGTDTTYCHDIFDSCPSWLTNGLVQFSTYYPDNEHIAGIYGYWLLSSSPRDSYGARNVLYYGGVYDDVTSIAGDVGLRAVITVSMFDLS